MFSLHYHKLVGKIGEYGGKKYFTLDDFMLNKMLEKIKMIMFI